MYINIYMDFGTLNYWLMKRTIEDIIMKINIDFTLYNARFTV